MSNKKKKSSSINPYVRSCVRSVHLSIGVVLYQPLNFLTPASVNIYVHEL